MVEKIGLELLFDVVGAIKNSDKFKNSLVDVGKAYDNVGKQSQKQSNLIISGITSTARSVKQLTSRVTGLALGFIGLRGIGSIWSKMVSVMPALGQGLAQTGKIIGNNLIYPLAKELMPLLIKIMTWVRDNRLVFVKIGVLLANMFRMIFSVLSQLANMVKKMFNTLFDMIIGKGKLTLDNFINVVNLIMLKVAFIFTMIMMLLEPIFIKIAKLAGHLWNDVLIPYVKEYWDQIKQLKEPLLDLIDAFDKLLGLFTDKKSEGVWKTIHKYVSMIGKVMGLIAKTYWKGVIKWATFIIKSFIWVIKTGIPALVSGFGKIVDKIKSIPDALIAMKDEFVSAMKTLFQSYIVDPFYSLRDKFYQFIKYARTKWNQFLNKIKSIGNSIYNGAVEGWNKFTNWIKNTTVYKWFASKFSGSKSGDNKPPHREYGGDVSAGTLYQVNEGHTKEYFRPNVNGKVIPLGNVNNNKNQSMTQNISINVDGSKSPQDTAQEIIRYLSDYRNQFIEAGIGVE